MFGREVVKGQQRFAILVQLGQISLDSTKIKANTSKHKALSYGHIEKLEAQSRASQHEQQRVARNGRYTTRDDQSQIDIESIPWVAGPSLKIFLSALSTH